MRQHIAQRLEILRRVEEGEKPTDLALALRVSPYVVYALLAKVGRGRMETLNARPLEPREPEPPPQAVQEPDPAPARRPAAPRRSPVRNPAAAEKTAQYVRERAAEKWGFASVESYQHMREQIRDLRLSGLGRSQIVDRLDMPVDFVKSVVQSWRREHGIVFPGTAQPKRKKAA